MGWLLPDPILLGAAPGGSAGRHLAIEHGHGAFRYPRQFIALDSPLARPKPCHQRKVLGGSGGSSLSSVIVTRWFGAM